MIRRIVGLLAILAGILLIVFGIVGGTSHFEGDQIGVDCGSAFSPKHFASGLDEASIITSSFDEVGCQPAMKAHTTDAWTMIGWGIALAALGAIAVAIPTSWKPWAAETDFAIGDDDGTDDGAIELAANGMASELERLAKLHAAGALNDDEFVQAKQRALGA